MLSNLKAKPGFLQDVIITYTLCPVFADSRCRRKTTQTKAKRYPESDIVFSISTVATPGELLENSIRCLQLAS